MAENRRAGPDPAARVASDPFWSALRRRHPDVDLVLLPPSEDAGEPAGDQALAEVDPDHTAGEVDALVTALWADLLGDRQPGERSARWLAGPVRGTTRREITCRLDDVDPVTGTAAVQRAEALLRGRGWHVLAPPDGMPRVLAGHPAAAAAGRDEVQVVFAPAESRLVLRLRSGAHRLVTPPDSGSPHR